MKIRVRLEQYDLLEKTSSILVETNAILKDNTLLYFEADGVHKHEIIFDDSEITLKRKGKQYSSNTVLPKHGAGEASVDSPYGMMKMDARLVNMCRTNEKWSVEYKLFQGNETVTHMRMVWSFTLQA